MALTDWMLLLGLASTPLLAHELLILLSGTRQTTPVEETVQQRQRWH